MSESDVKDMTYLEELKQAAEAQMRRPAPPLLPAAKKQKATAVTDTATAAIAADTDAADEPQVLERVGRYSYAATDAIMKGSCGFLGMCDFKRSNSATKEMLDILKQTLPGDRKLQLVKVGCRGLVVILMGDDQPQQHQQEQQNAERSHQGAEEQLQQQQQDAQQQEHCIATVQPTSVVTDILDRLAAGSLQRTKFCQRIAPIETTCRMAASPLKAAIKQVIQGYLARQCHSNSCSNSDSASSGRQQQQGPVEFAVMFKNRDSTVPAQAKVLHQLQTLGNQQQQQQHSAEAAAAQALPDSERLDKSKAISIAAAMMQESCQHIGGAKVNLATPQVVIMLEVLPLSGQQQACAVAAVPGSLIVTKPKLCVKPVAAQARGN